MHIHITINKLQIDLLNMYGKILLSSELFSAETA